MDWAPGSASAMAERSGGELGAASALSSDALWALMSDYELVAALVAGSAGALAQAWAAAKEPRWVRAPEFQ